MKQALVRHTDFLAGGGGGIGKTGVPGCITIDCLKVYCQTQQYFLYLHIHPFNLATDLPMR